MFFGKIEGSLQKYHIFVLNMKINSYKLICVTCNWLNLKHTVNHDGFQYHSAIWRFFLKKNIDNLYNYGQNCWNNSKSTFQGKNPSSLKSMLFTKFYALDNETWRDSTLVYGEAGEFEKLLLTVLSVMEYLLRRRCSVEKVFLERVGVSNCKF